MSDLITRIKARATEGRDALHFQPDCAPDWEGLAVMLFGFAMVGLACAIHWLSAA